MNNAGTAETLNQTTAGPSKQRRGPGRRFVKGQSGNPGGRAKQPFTVTSLARDATPEAMKTLIKIMKNDMATFSVRAYCANAIIDRAYGKAPQSLAVAAVTRPLAQLTDAELIAIATGASTLAELPPPTIEGTAVDVDPNMLDATDRGDDGERPDDVA